MSIRELDAMVKEQQRLAKEASPAQRRAIEEQTREMYRQLKSRVPLNLPVDQEAPDEARRQKTDPKAKKPQGGRKSRRKGRKGRKATRRR